MAVRIRHAERFNQVSPVGGPGSPQAYDADHEVEGLDEALALKAPLNSPTLTGEPTAPTAALGDNSMKLANTAFVKAAVDALLAGAPGALDTLNELAAALGNDASFSATVANSLTAINAALALRLRVDAAQSFDSTQKAQALANLGIAQNIVRFRNRIVNPSFQVSQENGNTAGSTDNFHPADQHARRHAGTGFTASAQRVQVVTPAGAVDRVRYTVSAAKASLAAGDALWHEQLIEGRMVADLRFGSASAMTCLLRFGIKAPAGSYGVALRNSANNRSWIGLVVVAPGEANTDVVKTLAIPGDTAGTWLTDSGTGLRFSICLASGSTLQGSAGWQGANAITTSAQFNAVASTSNVVELFDIGLQADVRASGVIPPYEVPDEADEVRRSQRYWESGSALSYTAVAGVSQVSLSQIFKVTKRVAPTISGLIGGHGATGVTVNEIGSINIASSILQTPWQANARLT